MSDITDKPDPLLWAARRERALRWLHTDLRGYPTVSDEAETEETLAAEPTPEQVKKRSTEKGQGCGITTDSRSSAAGAV